MATLTIPHSFTAGTPALASEVNANFQAIVSWTTGGLGTDNLGILTARSIALPSSPFNAILSINQSATEPALYVSNTGNATPVTIVQGASLVGSGTAVLKIVDPTSQATANTAHMLMELSSSATIPAIQVKHGTDTTMSVTKTQLGLFNSSIEISNARIKLPVRTSAQRDAITQEGSILYNTTDKVVQYRDNNEWKDFTPAGIIQMYGGSAAPTGWLICDGSEVSQTTYATLFAIIGSTYNTGGEAPGNFRLPNFQRRTAVGAGGTATPTLGNSVGNRGGAETVTLSINEIPSHDHGGTTGSSTVTARDGGANLGPLGAMLFYTQNGTEPIRTINSSGHTHTISSQGGGLAHNNLQPSLVVNYIIKV